MYVYSSLFTMVWIIQLPFQSRILFYFHMQQLNTDVLWQRPFALALVSKRPIVYTLSLCHVMCDLDIEKMHSWWDDKKNFNKDKCYFNRYVCFWRENFCPRNITQQDSANCQKTKQT